MTRRPQRIARLVQLSLDRQQHAELASLAGKYEQSVDDFVSELVADMLEFNRRRPERLQYPVGHQSDPTDDGIPF